jgi:hypothetical protein
MHAVELLEEATGAAGALGYVVRQEWLGGEGGGDCEIKGRKYVFLDLSLSVHERLRPVLEVLVREDAVARLTLSEPLARLVSVCKPTSKAA